VQYENWLTLGHASLMNNVKGIMIFEEKYLIRSILYLNIKKVTQMTQVLNKKLYAKMSN
jgi:hypothetical protein